MGVGRLGSRRRRLRERIAERSFEIRDKRSQFAYVRMRGFRVSRFGVRRFRGGFHRNFGVDFAVGRVVVAVHEIGRGGRLGPPLWFDLQRAIPPPLPPHLPHLFLPPPPS